MGRGIFGCGTFWRAMVLTLMYVLSRGELTREVDVDFFFLEVRVVG